MSKQAVFYRIKKPPLSKELTNLTTKKQGVLFVSVDGEKLIKKAFNCKDRENFGDKLTTKKVGSFDDNIVKILEENNKILKEELSIKNDQIKDQQEVIKEQSKSIQDLTSALSRQQALHAGTIQQQISDNVNVMDKEFMEEKKPNFFERIFGKNK